MIERVIPSLDTISRAIGLAESDDFGTISYLKDAIQNIENDFESMKNEFRLED
jgi:hypothetical protein